VRYPRTPNSSEISPGVYRAPRPSARPSAPAGHVTRHISRIWLSRARASRIRAGDERNSEFRVCEGKRGEREREKEGEESRALLGKRGITMPKRARIVVRPADTTDNSQCAKCIGIESGRFIFAPDQSALAFAYRRNIRSTNQKSAPSGLSCRTERTNDLGLNVNGERR